MQMRRRTGAFPRYAAAIALVCTAAPGLLAQETTSPPRLIGRLINLDMPGQAAKGAVSFQMGTRVFRSVENRTYWQADMGYGLNDATTIQVRAGLTGKATYAGDGFAIGHGGSDVEVLARFYAPKSAFTLGCSIPSTPGQNKPFLTAQGQLERTYRGVTFVLSPKAVLKQRPFIGIGGGISIDLAAGFSVIGDATALVVGHNTISPLTGDYAQTGIWGAGLRYNAKDLAVDLGATNGLGCTSAMSLTPGLGGSTAYYVSITYRR